MGASDAHAYTVPAVVQKSLHKHADTVALEFDETTLTYADLDERSNALARELRSRGIECEDRVALLHGNTPEFVVSDLAAVKAGGTIVPINEMLTHDEIKYVLADADAKALLCGPHFVEMAGSFVDELSELSVCLGVDDGEGLPDSVGSLNEAIESEGSSSPAVSVSPSDVAAHFYTSGTTGKPKGVIHTHRSRTINFYANGMELDVTENDRMLLMTPLTHSAGVSMWSGLVRGATAVIRDGFNATRTLNDIDNRDISWTYMVPTMIYRVLDESDTDDYDLSSLETLAYGSAPISTARLREALDLFGPVFKQFYGQTEVPQVVTTLGKAVHEKADNMGEDVLSSAGKPCLMADAKIVDPETASPVSQGEQGEIAVTAPYQMREYYERPKKTAETLQDGWVLTGDMGRLDERGYLHLLGRKADMIITGGMNVYSVEVEDELAEHPDVSNVAVIGVPDDDWGEAVHAVAVPETAHALTESDVLSFADTVLADYKKPKSAEFVDELPETPYGKIDKVALREDYWEDESRDIH